MPAAPAGVTAFVDVAVIPMDSERALPGQTVLVQEGRIIALGPTGQVAVPPGAMRVEGKGTYLMPGLADMHVHLAGSKSTAEAERWLLGWLSEGVVTVRNMDYLPVGAPFDNARGNNTLVTFAGTDVLTLRSRTVAGTLPSPRIYTSGPWSRGYYVTPHDPNLAPWTYPEPPPDSIATYVAAYKASGYDFVKVRSELPATFDSVIAAARRIGIPVVGHVPPEVSVEYALASGMRSIEHLTGYPPDVLHSRHVDQVMAAWAQATDFDTARARTLAAETRRAGVWSTPTLIVMGHAQVVLTGADRYVKALQDAGAGLLIGTDAVLAEGCDVTSVHRELQAFVAAGLTPYQALVAGTRNVALFLGTERESGTVAVGKRADLVLLRGNPLVDIRQTTHPLGVMIGGRWFPREDLQRRLAALEAASK